MRYGTVAPRGPLCAGSFTLIEAVICVVILSVALPSLMIALREGAAQRVTPLQVSHARWLAGEKLEDIIADRHSTGRGWGYVTSANYAAEPTIAGFAGYSRSVSISETGADLSSAGTGYKTITVTVSWVDGRGVSRSLSLSVVVTDYT